MVVAEHPYGLLGPPWRLCFLLVCDQPESELVEHLGADSAARREPPPQPNPLERLLAIPLFP